jgi:hypothetical protein
MSKGQGTNKKGKTTIGGVITTVLATIIMILAYLFGWGGQEAEEVSGDVANNTVDSQVISEEYEVEDEVFEEESEDLGNEVISEDEDSFVEEEVVNDETESEEVEETISEEESNEASSEAYIEEVTVAEITFRSQKLLDQHYDKHGIEMGFDSAEEYELAAYKVIIHPDTLHKIESEDGDDVYYREETNEFVVVSQDGYIRTYFNPNAGIDYYNRQ